MELGIKEKVALKGVYTFTIRDAKTGKIKRIYKYENIIPTVGRQMIANNLTNAVPTNLMRIKYAELGTGTNTPSNSDVALQTSSYRNAIASITNASNIAYATAFFGAAECSGTYKEAGIFCDGNASAGTGVLLSRVAINIVKTTSETLTIDWTLTII
jgi:hypothetical protein